MIRTLAFENYRSLRDLRLSLSGLTVITGGNGVGKSNVYRGLRLLADAVGGTLGRSLGAEGGMPSALWAGPERVRSFRPASARGRGPAQGTVRSKPIRLSLGFSDEDLAYELRLGLPTPGSLGPTLFQLDPEVKEETLRLPERGSRVRLLERRGPSATVRDSDGRPVTFGAVLDAGESVLAQLAEPHRYPLLSATRERLRRWRFYHQVRTDADSPLRAPQVGTRTPVLAHDGRDLAAALRTIEEIGDGDALHVAVADALDGARVEVTAVDARFQLALRSAGILRPLDAAELSDGALRYLALTAALLSPRPPELLVLNEPETSLHPRVLAPLARQIGAAATRGQVVVVTHSTTLVEEISRAAGAADLSCFELVKEDGETAVSGRRPLEEPPWVWTD
jgi:predicted ATPase